MPGSPGDASRNHVGERGEWVCRGGHLSDPIGGCAYCWEAQVLREDGEEDSLLPVLSASD